jgi:transcriptional regulator with XRE-family HTH domain
MQLFHIRLKQLRKSKKIMSKELASILNLTQHTVQNYEKGIREPKFDTLVTIAKYFNVSLDYLFGLTDDPVLREEELSEEWKIVGKIFLLSEENRKQVVDYIDFIKTKE